MRDLLSRCTLVIATLIAASTLEAQGRVRELYCRGNTGISLKVDQDPSPRDTAGVVMLLEYKPTALGAGDVHALPPGTCSWNVFGLKDVPVEPGRVRFDVKRYAQRYSDTAKRIMDTTARAAVFFPDPITLPRYLNDPSHYYKFYVDDQTNLAYSHQAWFESGYPTYVWITGPLALANDVRRDLLCRGGSTGLLYAGGTNAGDNLVKVLLTYQVSPTVPGSIGAGLSAGTCAWTDRTAMPREPGSIAFITARNAQLKQMQSGVPVDRTATAAERYPDMVSIPEYLKDPAHYWSFTVASRDPDSALTNGVWKRDLSTVATGTLRSPGTSPTVSLPSNIPGGGTYTPGGAGTTTSVATVFDIKNVVAKPGLDGVAITFDAAANIKPTVAVSTTAPVLQNGVYQFSGASTSLVVSGAPNGTLWHYAAALPTPLGRDTKYYYVISAPATAQARANQKTGEFKTLGQRVTIAFTQINLISDGDAGSNGEVAFKFQSCPINDLSYESIPSSGGGTVDWGDGPHNISIKMESPGGRTPDKLRVIVYGTEDDKEITNNRSSPPPVYCDRLSLIDPGRTTTAEWNSLIMDFDLTKYPGVKGGEQFVRRSKPLRNGSTLMFEVRGSILVTRQ